MNSVTSINKLDFSYGHKQQSMSKMSDNLSDLDEESPNTKLPCDTDGEPDPETPMIMHFSNTESNLDDVDGGLGDGDAGFVLNSRLSSEADFSCSQESATLNSHSNLNHSLDDVDVNLEDIEENQKVEKSQADESKL